MARWMRDEMVMIIDGHNVSSSCTERHYPPTHPPTHPPTPPPYHTLHAYVRGTNDEVRDDECVMKWWWSSKKCKLLTAANADVSINNWMTKNIIPILTNKKSLLGWRLFNLTWFIFAGFVKNSSFLTSLVIRLFNCFSLFCKDLLHQKFLSHHFS